MCHISYPLPQALRHSASFHIILDSKCSSRTSFFQEPIRRVRYITLRFVFSLDNGRREARDGRTMDGCQWVRLGEWRGRERSKRRRTARRWAEQLGEKKRARESGFRGRREGRRGGRCQLFVPIWYIISRSSAEVHR